MIISVKLKSIINPSSGPHQPPARISYQIHGHDPNSFASRWGFLELAAVPQESFCGRGRLHQNRPWKPTSLLEFSRSPTPSRTMVRASLLKDSFGLLLLLLYAPSVKTAIYFWCLLLIVAAWNACSAASCLCCLLSGADSW